MTRDLFNKVKAVLLRGRPFYLPLKLANLGLNRFERALGRTRLRSLPLGADIVTTRRCNCRCVMCIGYISRPPLEMPLELFQDISRCLFPTLLYVRFASGGEHFLHPHFREMLATCRRYGCPVTIVSNGTRINRDWAEFLVCESSVWSLIISFDGARPETFNAIRRGALFDRVVGNVRHLAEIKKQYESAFPVVSFRFVAMRKNIEELPDLIRLAVETGVEQVQVSYLTVSPDFDPEESLWHHKALARRVFDETTVLSKQYGVDLRLPPAFSSAPVPPGSSAPVPSCVLPWTQLYIDPSGSLRLCCNAWDDFAPMGDFSAADFRRVWNNERYLALRASLWHGKPLYARCRNCPAIARDPSKRAMHFV
jgi:MoaA/NifB/PqqE/SkfB family radical SAM enzyme